MRSFAMARTSVKSDASIAGGGASREGGADARSDGEAGLANGLQVLSGADDAASSLHATRSASAITDR